MLARNVAEHYTVFSCNQPSPRCDNLFLLKNLDTHGDDFPGFNKIALNMVAFRIKLN